MKNIIVIKNISKTYKQGEIKTPALKDINFEVKKGDFLIITGRNGSGKSTLLRQIGLLDSPDKGKIFIENIEITKLSEKKRLNIRLKNLGYIFQDYALLYDLTALENVTLPAMMLEKSSECKKRALKLLKKIGLINRINNLPNQLSGGEQQKVAIARALINNPKVIIADEPTANLDSKAAKDVVEIFKSFNQEGKTIVMVTHEEEETAYGNRIIKLADGKII